MLPATGETAAIDRTAMSHARPSTVFVCRTSARAQAATPASPGTAAAAAPPGPTLEHCDSEDLERLSRERPDADFLLLVEPPAAAIARRPGDGAAADATAALRDWCQSAARMQRHLRRHRLRTLMLDAGELAARGPQLPAALLSTRPWLVDALEAAIADGACSAATADPLIAMLARRAAEQDGVASDLYCELLAACEPIGDEVDTSLSADPPGVNGEWPLQAIDAIRGMRDDLARLRPHAQALQARLDEGALAAQNQRSALEDSHAQCRRLAADLSRVEADSAVRLQQLHTTQEELEKLFLAQRSVAAEQLVARTALELESGRLQAAEAAHATALQRLAEADRELDALRRQLAELEHTNQALGAREAQQSSEAQGLLLQLHKTQEELESNWLQLLQSRSEAEQVRAEGEALRAQVAQARALADEQAREHRLSTTALSEAEARVSAATQAMAQARAEAEALVSRATQARADAETRARAATQAQAEAEARARATVQAKAQAQAEAVAAQDALAQARAEAREHFDAATTESQRLRRELQASREAEALVQRQAEQALAACRAERRAAQEEALGHFLRLKTYEDSGPGAFMTLVPGLQGTTVDLGRIEIGAAHETGEHRHIDFKLLQAKTPRGGDAPLRLRLVEHGGRPGLALLRKDGEPEVLGAWQTHGQEDDTTFCLLIPGDTRCQALWLRLGGADWRFIVALVVQLEATLAEAALPAAAFWQAVARRLRMHLWQLPPRLRYDGVEVFGDTSGDGQAAVRIEFRNAIFGMRELGTVALCWRPAAGYSDDPAVSAVACLHDPGRGIGAPPLATWPVAADGTWAPATPLPVGPGMPKALRRRLWSALPIGDRQFVLALLDAMPAANEHLDSAPLTVPPHTATVARAARDLHKQARRTMLDLELRRSLRGLLRR